MTVPHVSVKLPTDRALALRAAILVPNVLSPLGMSVKSTYEAGNGLGGCSRCPPPTAINADFRPLGNYETKKVARTGKHPILTILRKMGDWEQSALEQ